MQVDYTDADVRSFLAAYGRTPTRLEITKLESWWFNLVLRLDADDETLILRRYGVTPPDEVLWELALLAHLRAQDFPTIAPLPRTDKDHLFDFQGKPAILYPYVEGHNACAERVGLSLAIAQTAATIARLHDLTEDLVLPHPRVRSGTDTRRMVRELIQLTTQRGIAAHETALRDFVDRVTGTLAHVDALISQHAPNLRRGIVHPDAHCATVLFHQERLVALIDFDDACEGFFIADLACMIANWASVFGGADPLDPVTAALVVREYERHRPLTQTERDLLPDFVVLFLGADMSSHVKEQLEQGADGNEAIHTWNGYRRYLHHSQDETWRPAFHHALQA